MSNYKSRLDTNENVDKVTYHNRFSMIESTKMDIKSATIVVPAAVV